MTRIYTDDNGVYANAYTTLADGTNVEGHVYYTSYGKDSQLIGFQRGPVKEVGVNGVTNEHLLAVLKHRITYLDGQFPSEYNKQALHHITEALKALEARTADRQKRGVEGTHAR